MGGLEAAEEEEEEEVADTEDCMVVMVMGAEVDAVAVLTLRGKGAAVCGDMFEGWLSTMSPSPLSWSCSFGPSIIVTTFICSCCSSLS